MRLAHIDITGFQGIKTLSLALDEATTLIGENAWGRRSFLNALEKVMGPQGADARFEDSDFYQQSRQLNIALTFVERHGGHWRRLRYRPLRSVMWGRADGHMRLRLCWRAIKGQGSELTFVDASGQLLLNGKAAVRLARHLLTLHPLLRLGFPDTEHLEQSPWLKTLLENPEQFQEQALTQGLGAVKALLARYFTDPMPAKRPRDRLAMARQPINWEAIRTLEQVINQSASRQTRLALLGLFGVLMTRTEAQPVARLSRPLLLLDMPEARLHPVMLATFWSLVVQLPLNRLLITQSAELLGAQDLLAIRRLVRRQGELSCYQLKHPLREDDYRRIGFHLRVNRPASLFARGWLLVEGETEIWLMSELAHLSGVHLAAEGIRVIDFAQCGLKPLVHLARDMGIAVQVLCDGDEAGNRYASQVRGLLGGAAEASLTQLPAKDIEHFFYQEGYQALFHQLARWRGVEQPSAIIHAAISRQSKPELALRIAEEAGRRGKEGVPVLLRRLFSQLRQAALASAPKD
ncbi:DUF2813 domain-containing protein [Gallaecimonas pentaromativorans]|uniref:Putative ATP-dependent endonuclease of OLD family n=1 Tax=Gallaecimonas pentaromativorans TaxID=584787 RepID=A0A3N1PRI1_9GAMM|nr:DUF2813 domain-containing protein [Gallaecimonas pentaromativorans]ROQ29721.1 putative ATP-dependent endonuclease of OLD family [Gallaecimonas pentaromativorans]